MFFLWNDSSDNSLKERHQVSPHLQFGFVDAVMFYRLHHGIHHPQTTTIWVRRFLGTFLQASKKQIQVFNSIYIYIYIFNQLRTPIYHNQLFPCKDQCNVRAATLFFGFHLIITCRDRRLRAKGDRGEASKKGGSTSDSECLFFRRKKPKNYTPRKINAWNIIPWRWMVQIIFLSTSKWVICRFHVNLPGCNMIVRKIHK